MVKSVALVFLAMGLSSGASADAGQCNFTNEPVNVGYFWDPTCKMGMLGCDADGHNMECRFCGAGDEISIACPPSSCHFPNDPSVPYYWDPHCELGKPGCWADGIHAQCRFCGEQPFTSIPCPEGSAPPLGAACNFTDEPDTPYYWESGCEMGKHGCNADGVNAQCRFCGKGIFSDIPCPASQVCHFDVDPTVPYYWDPACVHGGLGCNAGGVHAECRFCGKRPFEEVPCPGPVAPPQGVCTWPLQGEPLVPYFWDETCEMGKLGCWADAIHAECRFCGVGVFANITCPNSTALAPEVLEEGLAASASLSSWASLAAESAKASGEAGQCQFDNEPVAVGYFWDPTCKMGMLGCDADGRNVECRFCGAGDEISIACPPSSCHFPNDPSVPYYWDPHCEAGKPGCWADGIHAQCRFCGEHPYTSIDCPEGAAPPLGAACNFTDEPEIPYYWESGCEMGKHGCNADGVNAQCRFCGKGIFSDIPCPAAQVCSFVADPTVPYYWDPTCVHGGLGCNADGEHAECRFCGKRPFEEVSCPGPVAPPQRVCTWPLQGQPSVPYFWDETCEMGKLGCWADGIHAECRFCDVGVFENITCPNTTTTSEPGRRLAGADDVFEQESMVETMHV